MRNKPEKAIFSYMIKQHSTNIEVLAEISNPLKDLFCSVLHLASKTIKASLDKKKTPVKMSFTNLLNIKKTLQQIKDAQEKLEADLALTKKAEKEYNQAKADKITLNLKSIPNFDLIKSKIEGQLSQLFQQESILKRLIKTQEDLDQTLAEDIKKYIKTNKIEAHEKNIELLSTMDQLYEEIK